MTYIATDIDYDTDGVKVKLPKSLSIEVPDDVDDIEDFISNEISNITGWCHNGFNYNPSSL